MKWLTRLTALLVGAALLGIGLVLGTGWFIAPQDELRKSDAIVVVSGGDTAERTREGVRLWKQDWAPKLVFSGAAADQGTSNAAVMRNQAVAAGVPIEATIIEGQSRTTIENARFLKTVLEAQNAKRIIIVSSPYHTRRVKQTFKKELGKEFDIAVHPATDTAWRRSSWWKESGTLDLTLDELKKTFYVVFLQRRDDNRS